MTEAGPLIISSRDLSNRPKQSLDLFRQILVVSILLALSLAIGLALASSTPWRILSLAIPLALLPILWFRPTLSVYLLIAGAALFETFRLNFRDSFTDQVPFFHSFSSIRAPITLPVTPAELLMLFALGILILKRIAAREKPLEFGPLFWVTAFYTFMVGFGVLRGVGTGGSLSTALYEARPQIDLFLAFLLAYNLIRDRGQVKLITWIFLAAVGFKGLIGSWRFLITLDGNLQGLTEISTGNSLMAHEESIFFVLFFTFMLILFLFRSDNKQFKFCLILSLPVLLSFLANQRRAGTLALILCILVIGLMAYMMLPSRRKLIVSSAVLMALILPAYILAFGNSPGLIGQPARAVTSAFQPDERDQSSNEYRVLEAENVKRNIALNPLLGSGYGKPMVMFLPIPDLSYIFQLWDTIPHNTILWVWMRLGLVGFVAYLFMVGRTLVESAMTARAMKDPYLRGIAIFTIAVLLSWLAEGAVDMGLIDFRETIVVGVLMGVAPRLNQMAQGNRLSAVSRSA